MMVVFAGGEDPPPELELHAPSAAHPAATATAIAIIFRNVIGRPIPLQPRAQREAASRFPSGCVGQPGSAGAVRAIPGSAANASNQAASAGRPLRHASCEKRRSR